MIGCLDSSLSDRSTGSTECATSNRSDSEAEATGNSSLEGDSTLSTSSVSNLHDWQPQAPVPHSRTVCNDIGLLLRKGVCIRKLTDDHKLKIARLDPDPHANYPSVFMNGCNCRFKVQWLHSHPRLHYSATDDGAYCRACVLFSPKEVSGKRLGVLTTEPFHLWTKQSTVFEHHEKLDYHHNTVVRMQEFVKACENPSINIANRLSRKREVYIEPNKEAFQSLFECTLFCATQRISLSGHRDDATASPGGNRGNFIKLVKFRAKTEKTLAAHLRKAPLNATYTSKSIQNQMISIIGEAIQDGIIQEINDTCFFTILADEVKDCSNLERLSIAI